MRLAFDTIDRVLQAERNADEAEKNAAVESDGIVAKAENEAMDLKDELEKKSKEKAKQEIDAAKAEADEVLTRAKQEADALINDLKSSVSSKEGTAVKLILDEIQQ
ncbi:MAG: hypothetical protein IJS86_07870 [Lachnospiraceae bacterium]|nr:hypothetical protein [Lachnospiraceae bacterium]